MATRKRSRIIPGRKHSGDYVRYVSTFSEETPWTKTPIDAPSEPIREYHEMVDEDCQRQDRISNPIQHYRVKTHIHGGDGPPDGSLVGSPTATRYQTYVETATGSLIGIPTMAVLDYAVALFPAFKQARGYYPGLLHKECNWPEWGREGWKSPKISLYSDFNVLNFLVELNQSLALVASWVAKKALLKRWHALMGHNQTLKGRAKAVANERLAHVYGTELFLRDAAALFRLIISWKDRADMFLSNSGMLLNKRKPMYQRGYSTPTEYKPFPMFGASESYAFYSETVSVKCCSTLYYKYICNEVKGFCSRLGQLCDTFGIKVDLGTAWDAIPFSFVVDWFINVGEWLHANAAARDWTRVDLVLMDCATSGKVQVLKQLGWNRVGSLEGTSLLATREITYYERRSIRMPSFKRVDLEFSDKAWKLGRIINASALFGQQTLRDRDETPLWFNYRGAQRKKARQFKTKFKLM